MYYNSSELISGQAPWGFICVCVVPLFCACIQRSMCRPYHPHICERLFLWLRPAACPLTLMRYPLLSRGREYIEICRIHSQILSHWSSKSDRWNRLEGSSISQTADELEADIHQWRTTYPGTMMKFLEGCCSHTHRLLVLYDLGEKRT